MKEYYTKKLEMSEAILSAFEFKAQQELISIGNDIAFKRISLTDAKQKIEFVFEVVEYLHEEVEGYKSRLALIESATAPTTEAT